jgi:hypothetical protein
MSRDDNFDLSSFTDTQDLTAAFQEMYEKLDVKQKNEEISKEITEYVDTLVNKFTKDVEISAISKLLKIQTTIETKTVISAYKQSIYLEHLVDTVMSRIDENFGGSGAEYSVLLRLQSSLITMNQYLLTCIRMLPSNLKFAVMSTLDAFAIEAKTDIDNATSGKLVAKQADLIEHVEKAHAIVSKKNIEVANEKPDTLPADWIITDEALMQAEDVEEAKKIHAEQILSAKQAIELDVSKEFPDDEFDED